MFFIFSLSLVYNFLYQVKRSSYCTNSCSTEISTVGSTSCPHSKPTWRTGALTRGRIKTSTGPTLLLLKRKLTGSRATELPSGWLVVLPISTTRDPFMATSSRPTSSSLIPSNPGLPILDFVTSAKRTGVSVWITKIVGLSMTCIVSGLC